MNALASWDPARVRRRIVFWRHGRTDWNAQGRYQGQLDIGLDVTGALQAKAAARHLAAIGPTKIVSSDLSRARKTAEVLASLCNLPVTADARLRETYLGAWQGLTHREISQRFGDQLRSWHAGSVSTRPGGGENRMEMAQRMAQGILDAVAELGPNGTVVVATHGGAARVGIAHLVGLPHEHWGALGGLSNCNWSILEEDEAAGAADGPRWRLTEHNAGTLPGPDTVEEG